jgi:hypothetical protein
MSFHDLLREGVNFHVFLPSESKDHRQGGTQTTYVFGCEVWISHGNDNAAAIF